MFLIQTIQRRFSGDEDFYLDWSDYRNGFGNKSGEYWLGKYTTYNYKSKSVHLEGAMPLILVVYL